MSESSSPLRRELIANGGDRNYRHGYAHESLNISIATQLKVLREQRGWRQEDLANEAGMRQSMISRYENVNYSSWSINTLRKLAIAFDAWLDVRFRSFAELVTVTEGFSRESLQVPKFAEDPYFKEGSTVVAGGTAFDENLILSAPLAGEEDAEREMEENISLFEAMEDDEIPAGW